MFTCLFTAYAVINVLPAKAALDAAKRADYTVSEFGLFQPKKPKKQK